jgi:hypothetical protein
MTENFFNIQEISECIGWAHTITHYFGHPNDDFTSMCLGSQKDILHEEND